MRNPIQFIKDMINNSSRSEQKITLNPAKATEMNTPLYSSPKHGMIEPTVEEHLRNEREVWLNQAKELIRLIVVDFMPKYYPGKKIEWSVESRTYKDGFSQETYEAPALKIKIDNEVFELARSRAETFSRDRYYSMSNISYHNGKHVNFQRGAYAWMYTTLNNDKGWKSLNEDGFREIMDFIKKQSSYVTAQNLPNR